MLIKDNNLVESKNLVDKRFENPIKGIYIFKSDSGITLYSKRMVNVQEDLFSAYLTALKGFFSRLALGGLSSVSSKNYFCYLATSNNVLTALIVDSNRKSDKYFNLAFSISTKFYHKYKNVIENNVFHLQGVDQFNKILDELISKTHKQENHGQQDIIHLYTVSKEGKLEKISYTNKNQLYNEDLFILVNLVTKQIFIVENSTKDISNSKLFLANKFASSLNHKVFKSGFHIRNVTDAWGFDRIIEMIHILVKKESFIS